MGKPMSDAEIRRRKKIQSASSRAGGTLGLTALGAFGASKVPGSRVASKLGRLNKINPKKMENIALGASTAGAGIGGAASFNFASYTSAEAKKRQRKPIAKGHLVIAKKWEPVATNYTPEGSRKKRNQNQVKALAGVSGAAAGAGAYRGLAGLELSSQAKTAKAKKKAYRPLKAAAKGRFKTAGKYGAVSAVAGGGAVALNRRRKSESWS